MEDFDFDRSDPLDVAKGILWACALGVLFWLSFVLWLIWEYA